MVSVGEVLDGKVMSVMPFGAFVEIGKNVSGLVHISEVSSDYVKDINEHIKKGDSVKVKVIKIDDDGKISLSIKQAAPPSPKREKRKEEKPQKPAKPKKNFFSKFVDKIQGELFDGDDDFNNSDSNFK